MQPEFQKEKGEEGNRKKKNFFNGQKLSIYDENYKPTDQEVQQIPSRRNMKKMTQGIYHNQTAKNQPERNNLKRRLREKKTCYAQKNKNNNYCMPLIRKMQAKDKWSNI